MKVIVTIEGPDGGTNSRSFEPADRPDGNEHSAFRDAVNWLIEQGGLTPAPAVVERLGADLTDAELEVQRLREMGSF